MIRTGEEYKASIRDSRACVAGRMPAVLLTGGLEGHYAFSLPLPAADGINRYPALEIMTATDAVRNLIRRGDDHQLRSQLTISRAEGMITMEQSLAELVRTGHILRETATAHCYRQEDLKRVLEG